MSKISPDSSISPSSPDKIDCLSLEEKMMWYSCHGGNGKSSKPASDTWSISSRNVNNGGFHLRSVHGSNVFKYSGDRLTDSRTAGYRQGCRRTLFVEILVDRDDAFGSHTGGTGPSRVRRLGPSVGKGLLSGLRASQGAERFGSSSNVNVGGGRGSWIYELLKGDAMPKMPDHICRLCQLDFARRRNVSHPK
ncbi:hypothetical protein BC829DRAFT_398680, partial [Chytridium lagenaria]